MDIQLQRNLISWTLSRSKTLPILASILLFLGIFSHFFGPSTTHPSLALLSHLLFTNPILFRTSTQNAHFVNDQPPVQRSESTFKQTESSESLNNQGQILESTFTQTQSSESENNQGQNLESSFNQTQSSEFPINQTQSSEYLISQTQNSKSPNNQTPNSESPNNLSHSLESKNHQTPKSESPINQPQGSKSPNNQLQTSKSPINQDQSSSYFPKKLTKIEQTLLQNFASCNIFDGTWVRDDRLTLYPGGTCPFIDEEFDCQKNGRNDTDFLRWRWKPNGCSIPRFDGKRFLEILRGKRLVFVGDSLNRNMWESLVCTLRDYVINKTKVFEASGLMEFKTQGSYSIIFEDYNCSVEFIRTPFLVQEWEISTKTGKRKETLRLDLIEKNSSAKYKDADIIIFNTGHWWTHEKTFNGKDYYQEGNHVYRKLDVYEAYTKGLRTWAQWVDSNINTNRTRIFFRGYSASHYRKKKWYNGGRCDREVIKNTTNLSPYLGLMHTLESIIAEMKTPIWYFNITEMTEYRKDAHPNIYRLPEDQRQVGMPQDCSHWCLPGLPEIWNEILYGALLVSEQNSSSINSS